MQVQPKNPDQRRLPPGWTEHFDPQSKRWYYINLDVEPHVTFVHPCDDVPTATQPISPLSTTTNLSPSTSISSPSGGLAKAKRKDESRVGTRAGKLRDTTRISPKPTMSSSKDSQPTAAQQLYASALGSKVATSPPHSRRPSISSSHTGSNSDQDETSTAGASSSTSTSPPKSFVYKRPPHSRQARKNSSATNSPSMSPISANILLDSHDPRNFFDCTRLSKGTRRLTATTTTTNDGSSSSGTHQGVSAAASSASPSALSPYTNHHSLTSISARAASSGDHESSANANLLLNFGKPSNVSSDSTSVAVLTRLSKDAQALYNPSVFAKPVTSSSTLPSSVHRNRGSLGLPVSTSRMSTSTPAEQKQVPPLTSSNDKRSSDTLRLYSAITEDEKLRAMPNPGSGSLLSIPGTLELDQMASNPSNNHGSKRRESHSPSAINVLDVQNSSSPTCMRIQTKLTKRNTVAHSLVHKGLYPSSSLSSSETPVLQQPRPVRPISAVPARFNLQLETTTEQGSSVDQDSERVESAQSSVFRRFSLLGTPRREPLKSLSRF